MKSLRFLLVAATYCVIVYAIPRPLAVKPEGWRLLGIFLAAVAGLILQPAPGGAVVLTAVACSAVFGGLTVSQALAGYGDATVWFVLMAFLLARALIATGLARRISLYFVRVCGRSSLGICYGLAVSDFVLASVIPSGAARSGGVILPIARSLAELYGSKPGATAGLLGAFLMTGVYQSICITPVMFLTAQAPNTLAAQMAGQFHYTVTYGTWFAMAFVPGLCSLAIVPWVVSRLQPPEIRHTPDAAEFARREAAAMGPASVPEKILAVVFLGVCGLWVTGGLTRIEPALAALAGVLTLVITGVLSWDEVKREQPAWDVFIWYGGLVRLGKGINDAGVTTELARGIGSLFPVAGWALAFVVVAVAYFYVHYAFPSIIAQLLTMFPPFVALLLGKGAPAGLVVYTLIVFGTLGAGLTHYGTSPAPMFFAQDYVPLRTWWRIGLVVSVVNLAIWGVVGVGWWKLIGIW